MKSPDPMVEALRRQSSCPDITLLGKFLESQEQDPELRRHVKDCPACKAEVALLLSFELAAPTEREQADVVYLSQQLQQKLRVDPAPAKRQSWFAFSRWNAVALAAACLAIIAIGVSRNPMAELRNPSEAPVYRGATKLRVIVPPNGMTETFDEIRWEEFRGATNYRAEIREVDGAIAWHEESRGTQLRVDQRLRSVLLPGKRVSLVVQALNNKNERIAESDPVQIRLERPER